MDEKVMVGLIAELKDATAQAIGILTIAVAAQIDATKLAADLRKALSDAPPEASMAVELSQYALLAADGVARGQRPKMH